MKEISYSGFPRLLSNSAFMKRVVRALLLLLATTLPAPAEPLPIRIDAPRRGTVYIRKVEQGSGFEVLSQGTPATYSAEPGERIDIRVVAPEGLLHRWEGDRQNVAGPANVTIRLEKLVAWDRVAYLGAGGFLIFLGFFFHFRRKAHKEHEVARSQIIQLKERAASAEKVGALARTLGEYRVLKKLGAGAMGVVYLVQGPQGGTFAAKVPNEMDDRVLREAEVSASLKSPYIVECFGMVEGDPSFLLMEYMAGETVHEWLADHPRPSLAEIDRLVSQLLGALAEAHGKGVFHRDIKPENLFLCNSEDGWVLKVMDFGLASSINAARLTRTGEAMGTPIYASPEQLSGNPVDATTDLYSVGVLIYELATGKLPWSKTDPVALTLQKYKPLPQEPVSLRQDLPMEWNQLVVDLLNGDPHKRPRSAQELQARWVEGRRHL